MLHYGLARLSYRAFLRSSNNPLFLFICTNLFFSFQIFVYSLLMKDLKSLTSVVGGLDSFNARGVHFITRYYISNDIPGAKTEASI